MPLDWEHGALAEGLRCYRGEEFFLAHEHWEAVWLAAEEPEKTFLQCLIQIAAALHHLRRNNTAGALSLLGRSLRRLAPFPSEYGGVDVEGLRHSAEAWIRTIERQESPEPPFPRVR